MLSISYTIYILKNIFLLSLFYCVTCDPTLGGKEWVLLTKPLQFQTHTTEKLLTTPPKIVATVYDDISEVKFGKIFTLDPYLYDPGTEFTESANPVYRHIVNILSREAESKDDEIQTGDGLHCLRCFTDRGFTSDEGCYSGNTSEKIKCSSNEICYTELHPQYIKRGCYAPKKMNRTFVCNCPLCNDKPVYDSIYYEYKKISDWDYHNKRIQIPIAGMQLICKACETRGFNTASDDNCRLGKIDDYIICRRNQVCFVNYDERSKFVARGCVDTPVYNSIFYLCTNSLCNSKPFNIPKLRSEKLLLNELSPEISTLTKSTAVTINCINVLRMLLFLKAVLAMTNLYLS